MKKRYKLLLFVLFLGCFLFKWNTGSAQIISRYAVDDAVVNQTYPDSVIDQTKIGGNILAFRKKNTGGTFDEVYSYIKFDISQLKGLFIESAILSYRGKTGDASFNDLFKLGVYVVTSDWKGDTLKWKTKPSISSSKYDTSFLNASSNRKDFLKVGTGIVDYINEEIRKGSKTISFAIKSFGKDSTTNMWIGGSANGNYGPILNCKATPLAGRYAIEDAVLMEAYPDSIIDQSKIGGNLKAYRAKDKGGVMKKTISLIKFDISDLNGIQLESVSISYRGKTGDANYNDLFKIALYPVTKEWSSDTLKWKNRPTFGVKMDTSFLNASSNRKTFYKAGTGILDFVNEEIRKGSKTVSFSIQSFGKDSTDNMWMGGTANGNYGPIFEFTQSAVRSKYAIDDAVVMEQYPDSIIDQSKIGGNIKAFRKRESGVMKQTYSFVKFDISDLTGTQLDAATISYRGKTGDATFNDLFKLSLYQVNTDWKGDTVKWKTKPGIGSSKLDTSFLNASSSRKDFLKNGTGLLNYINEEIRKGSKTVSFAIRSFGKDSTDNMWIGGTANGNYGPILNYTVAPKKSAYSIDDAVVMQAYPDSVIDQSKIGGNILAFRKRNTGGTLEQTYSYVKFDLTGIQGKQIDDAVISYRGKTGDATFNDLFKLSLYQVNTDWKGDTVKWKTKPGIGSSKLDTSFLNASSTRKDFLKNGTGLVNYINEEIRKGSKSISFAIRSFGKDTTTNMWIGGTANGNYGPILNLGYKDIYGPIPPAPIVPDPLPGTYIKSVLVRMMNKPSKDTIFYTAGNGSNVAPTRDSTIFPEAGILITDTTVLKLIASRDGIYGPVTTATYNIIPVDLPQFNPSPAVKYQKQVKVTITVFPADAVIYYSMDGSDPGEPYTGQLILNKTTTLKAKAFTPDFSYVTPIVSVTYEVVNTEDLPGNGPAGVGFKNLTRSNQPELGLWLKPEALTGIADGAEVKNWNDMSGNGNNAVNTYEGTPAPIENTSESTKPAPLFVENSGLGFPVLNFGVQSGAGNLKCLTVPDADQLDGGGGISLFLVMKRNEMYPDFAALIQKRDTRGSDPTKQAYTWEMDGGVNPNKAQFVLSRDLFLKNTQVLTMDKYYILNVNYQGGIQLSSFITDGKVESTNFYNKPVYATNATLIIAGFQPMNVAEVISFNSDMNKAQINIVTQYLAAKYGLTLVDGNLITPGEFTQNIIGVGKDDNINANGLDEHLYSSGGGIELKASSFANAGEYVFASHSSAPAATRESKLYYIKPVGTGLNVTLGFDLAALNMTNAHLDSLQLRYSATADGTFENLAIVPTKDARNVASFVLSNVAAGYYKLYKDTTIKDAVDVNSLKLQLGLYPNPASRELTVNLVSEKHGPAEFNIIDLGGRTLSSTEVQKSGRSLSYTLNIEQLSAGTYILEVKQGGERSKKIFVKK